MLLHLAMCAARRSEAMVTGIFFQPYRTRFYRCRSPLTAQCHSFLHNEIENRTKSTSFKIQYFNFMVDRNVLSGCRTAGVGLVCVRYADGSK